MPFNARDRVNHKKRASLYHRIPHMLITRMGNESMDNQLLGLLAQGLLQSGRPRHSTALWVRDDHGEHSVTRLTQNGFVISAQGRPPLRGFADIFQGNERLVHGLVVCTWAEDGEVGYEFKRASHSGPVPVDHVAPGHAGLLSPL